MNPTKLDQIQPAINSGRMGLVQYSKVLAAITSEPRTHEQVADIVRRKGQSIREILWRLEHMGEAHVVRWQPPENRRSIMLAVFSAGPGPSVPYPRPLNRKPPGSTLARSNPKPELISFCNVIKELREGGTRAELHEATGVAPMRLGLLLHSLHRAGLVHVSGWLRDGGGGYPAQVFVLGAGKDAPRPKRLSNVEKQVRYRTRRRTLIAMQRVTHATAGSGAIQVNGMQSYGLLGVDRAA